MFYYICGEYIHREEGAVVIDCQGVGYRLTVSQNTADALGVPQDAKGKTKLLTHFQVREDGVELFGFYTEEELDAFKMLISVSGVGPKAAMAILSILTPQKLAAAVCTGDQKIISRANGVGAKTAARIVLELKDKMKALAVGAEALPDSDHDLADALRTAAAPAGKLGEATDALTVLGYSRAEVSEALRHLDTAALTVEQIIMAALKYLAK